MTHGHNLEECGGTVTDLGPEANEPAWLNLDQDARSMRLTQLRYGADCDSFSAQQTLDGVLTLEGPPYSQAITAVSTLRRLAAGEELTPDDVDQLASHEDSGVRATIASHPLTSPAVLSHLLSDSDGFVRHSAASNAHLPVELLHDLVNSPDREVRSGLAGNCALPLTLIECLAGDAEPSVRQRLARNGVTPTHVLNMLVEEPDPETLWGVASNPCITFPLAEQVAQSPDDYVRRALASNPSTPPEILDLLSQDASAEVRVQVEQNPATTQVTVSSLRQGHRYQYQSERVYRHVLALPLGAGVDDVDLYYLTQYLSSSVAEILDSTPNVGIFDPVEADDPDLAALYEDELDDESELLITDVRVEFSFLVQTPHALTAEQLTSSLDWELEVDIGNDKASVLATVEVENRTTLLEVD